jgi:hypothetical protein
MLHRAFSVFLFTPEGKLLLQQVRRGAARIDGLSGQRLRIPAGIAMV